MPDNACMVRHPLRIVVRASLALFCFWSIILLASPANAKNYYVDCSAQRDGDGSLNAPWNLLSEPSAHNFVAGDQLLFLRGSRCSGALKPQGSGDSSQPITVDAYGTGAQPVIDGGDSDEETLLLKNQRHWTIQNLEVVGGKRYGIFITGDQVSPLNGFTLKNLNVHDCHLVSKTRTDSGEVVISSDGKNETMSDILIDGVNASNTTCSEGIFVSAGGAWIVSETTPQPQGRNVVVQNSVAHDTYGDGILVSEAIDVVMQDNVVFNTGECLSTCQGTPVGLWEWYTTNATVQRNESYGNKSGAKDGGAFDIDYYNKNNTVQYNYGHDNYGYCVAVFGASDTSAESVTSNSVIRYNVCSSNGQAEQGSVNDFTLYTWNHGFLDGVQIYNNTSYWNPIPGNNHPALSVNASFKGNLPNFFKNNIVYAVSSQLALDGNNKVDLDYNLYYASRGAISWKYMGVSYVTFDAFVAASRQEQHGLNVDPKLNDPQYHLPGRPLKAFLLRHGSPAIDAGTNVCQGVASCSMGIRDFSGNIVPKGKTYDIGANEAE